MNPEPPTSAATPPPVSGGTPPRTLARDAVILMYHHCSAPPADAVVRGLYVTPEQFAWQMDWLLNRNVAWCTFADLEPPDAAVTIADAPFVEGAVAATVTAAAGADLTAVAKAAEEAWDARKL